ncbi:AAA family ATPase [Aestuariivivens sediminis]|uniref:AAA family ATPase n=1 Tax=Aestuariivivens sediminis TaxID=2913557 RepID=UPI001F58F800|nr:AAA family ATPase [Aestuariivivens sediminis]
MLKNNDEEKIKVKKLIDLIKEVELEPEPKFIWNGIIEGSHGLIVGQPKTGKTTFAENLAISLSVGRKEFFGFKLDGQPKKVLFINLEESYKVFARRNKRQIEILNDKELKLFEQNFQTTPKDFLEFINDDKDWKQLHNYIAASDAEIVFLDSLTNMFSGVIERSDDGRLFIEKFSMYLKSLNKTFIVLHHNTKGNERPPEQTNVAGSRVILQYFEFIYALAEIPTESGGHYFCDIQNKYAQKDTTLAHLYRLGEDYWFENIGRANKYKLYKEGKSSNTDGRFNEDNENLIYDYMLNQYNQGNQTISTSTMMSDLVYSDLGVMSHDTLHKAKNKLIAKSKIERVSRGVFKIIQSDGDEQYKEGLFDI